MRRPADTPPREWRAIRRVRRRRAKALDRMLRSPGVRERVTAALALLAEVECRLGWCAP